MAKAINLDGLKSFYQKLKQWIEDELTGKVDKVNGKGLSTNDLTDELLQKLNNAGDSSFSGNYNDLTGKPGKASSTKEGLMYPDQVEKLEGIEAGANKYIHPIHTNRAKGLYKITVDSEGHVSGAESATKADITALGIPEQDTTYEVATQTTPGLESPQDKMKLDGIQAGAQVNIIETIKVNGSAVSPTAKAVSLTIPTKMSQLLNDGSFATTSDVTTAVANAVSGKLQREFVNSLPATLQDNVIYSVPKQTADGQPSNVRIEYMKGPDGNPEIVGDTKVDLTDYWKEDWASAADIDSVVFGE